jgi:NAD(P)H-quinone oxidoreductase subunit 4
MGETTIYMPKIFTMFSSFSMASLALFNMSGFVTKNLVFLGIASNPIFKKTFKVIITIIEAIGITLTPIYLLSMLHQTFYGYKLS